MKAKTVSWVQSVAAKEVARDLIPAKQREFFVAVVDLCDHAENVEYWRGNIAADNRSMKVDCESVERKLSRIMLASDEGKDDKDKP